MFRYVATCMVTVAKKVKQAGGALLGSKHQGHNVSNNHLPCLSFDEFYLHCFPVWCEHRGPSVGGQPEGARAEEVLLGVKVEG